MMTANAKQGMIIGKVLEPIFAPTIRWNVIRSIGQGGENGILGGFDFLGTFIVLFNAFMCRTGRCHPRALGFL